MKFNRFRTLIDISVQQDNRIGEPQVLLDSPETQHLFKLDLHANNYRDGKWGSVRHIVVKDGNIIFFNFFV